MDTINVGLLFFSFWYCRVYLQAAIGCDTHNGCLQTRRRVIDLDVPRAVTTLMDKENLQKLAESPEFIAGIYNYCDRWCERCPFTSRCMNFALGLQEFNDTEVLDITSHVFWEKLNEIFKVTIEMVEEMAAEQGMDLDAINSETVMENDKIHQQSIKNHHCARAARQYGAMADRWFDSSESVFEGIGSAIPVEEIVEVIRWYQYQIYVKITRALHGKLEEQMKIDEGFPKDSDGSANVALIGIDRSMAAWNELMESVPQSRNSAHGILVHLARLRRLIERNFPDARDFMRPGFDEIHQYPIIGVA